MIKVVLRNFLYLDTDMLSDYLSAVEGYIVESEELSENQITKTSGTGSAKVVGISRGKDKEQGSVRRAVHTDAGRFQRLYQILEEKSILQYLENFDLTIWNSIKRDEILEIPALISIPDNYKMIQEAQNMGPLINLMRSFGEIDIVDKSEMNAINGIKAIGDMNQDKDIPVILNLEHMKDYMFATQLIPEYLRCDINKLEGEIKIVGKVQRIIKQGEDYELFSMVSGVDELIKLQNREERRKHGKKKADKNMADYIKGPAIILIPLAIFR